MYKYIIPKNPVWTAIFTLLCNSLTRQSIVLESCSNLKRLSKSSGLHRKKFLVLGFGLHYVTNFYEIFVWLYIFIVSG